MTDATSAASPLRNRMIDDMSRRNLSPATQRSYLHSAHIHCLVPGGALSSDGRWLGCRPRVFLPIHVLSRLFRRLFPERLNMAHTRGRLRFSGAPDQLDDAYVFASAVQFPPHTACR